MQHPAPRYASPLGFIRAWLWPHWGAVVISASSLMCALVGSLRVEGEEPPTQPATAKVATVGTEHGEWTQAERRLQRAFRKQIFPLLTDVEKGCVDCHSTEGTSQLVLSGNPTSDFRWLLDQQYLRTTGADTLLNRVTTEHVERRMPKDAPAWTDQELKKLTRFLKSVQRQQEQTGVAPDECFPRALLEPYRGPVHDHRDNQFISYRQLRGKIQTQFEDDWVRQGRDLFAENVAMFGGADFQSRFDESTQPSASFLTGLETMARDVSTRAYEQGLGPFRDFSTPDLPIDGSLDEAHRRAIETLYQRILFRTPTQAELQQAFQLLQSVYQLDETISQRHDQLSFQLTVTDPITGLARAEEFRIPVSGERMAVQQWLVDQTQEGRLVLGDRITLAANDPSQRITLHNAGTVRNVSFAAVEIYPYDSDQLVRAIPANSNEVELEGAWQIAEDDGQVSLEDKNQHKGLSLLSVPLTVEHAGDYRVVLRWRSDKRNARDVLVELFTHQASSPEARSQLANPTLPPVPPLGEARFYYDCSEDAKAYFAPPASFQFDQDSRVRIANDGTLDQVTAGAIEFTQANNVEQSFLIDSLEADEAKKWKQFDEGRFKAYNVKGAKLHDDNRDKGQRELNYRVVWKADSGWQADERYQLKLYYPGKRDQECQVPVTVYAKSSSPIIQVSHPRIAKADALVKLDASHCYTVEHNRLEYHWQQLSGTRVNLADPHAACLEFTAPRRSAIQAAWVALSAALVRHPDFLFTRPPSLFETTDVAARQRLQAVKLALDLVGRSPDSSELKMLESGKTLEHLANHYLESDEFRQFYFHRIRLYLESQGTPIQDEPVQLWCYVAFAGRPFQEILTADYTADAQFQKQSRPDYHGRTGVLTTPGFIQGKPGLPHYNYAAQVSMLFLGFVYEVPAEIVELREGVTALGTTDPNSVCYSCHKILTPLAFQRSNWTDDGKFILKDEYERLIDATDRGASADYPFPGEGIEAFATQAVRKERFIRTMINTHVNFYFGRPLRYRDDERQLYRRLWDRVHESEFQISELVRAIVTSPEYLAGHN